MPTLRRIDQPEPFDANAPKQNEPETNQPHTHKTTRYTGSYYSKRDKCYRAAIGIDAKQRHLGAYRLATDAAYAYDMAVRSFHLATGDRGRHGSMYKINFECWDRYVAERRREIQGMGLCSEGGIEGVDVVERRVKRFIDGVSGCGGGGGEAAFDAELKKFKAVGGTVLGRGDPLFDTDEDYRRARKRELIVDSFARKQNPEPLLNLQQSNAESSSGEAKAEQNNPREALQQNVEPVAKKICTNNSNFDANEKCRNRNRSLIIDSDAQSKEKITQPKHQSTSKKPCLNENSALKANAEPVARHIHDTNNLNFETDNEFTEARPRSLIVNSVTAVKKQAVESNLKPQSMPTKADSNGALKTNVDPVVGQPAAGQSHIPNVEVAGGVAAADAASSVNHTKSNLARESSKENNTSTKQTNKNEKSLPFPENDRKEQTERSSPCHSKDIAGAKGAKEKIKHYIGVKKRKGKYNATVIISAQEKYFLGTFILHTDACHAFDMGANEFNLLNPKRNFHSSEEYNETREQELKERGIRRTTVGSAAVIEKQIRHFISKKQQPKQKIRTTFKGVCHRPEVPHINQYNSRIFDNSKRYLLGYYALESDAAYAFDEGINFLSAAGRRSKKKEAFKTNFKTLADYHNARLREMEARSITIDDVGSLEGISEKIMIEVDKFKSSWLAANKMSLHEVDQRNEQFTNEDAALADEEGASSPARKKKRKRKAKSKSPNKTKKPRSQKVIEFNDKADVLCKKWGPLLLVDQNQHQAVDTESYQSEKVKTNRTPPQPAVADLNAVADELSEDCDQYRPEDPESNQSDNGKAMEIRPSAVPPPQHVMAELNAVMNALAEECDPLHHHSSASHQRDIGLTKETTSTTMTLSKHAVVELNFKNDVLTKKWGTLFGDQIWQQPDYIKTHQLGIEKMLLDLKRTDVKLRKVRELQEHNQQESALLDVSFNIESKSNANSETMSPTEIETPQEPDHAVVPEVPFAENYKGKVEVRPSLHPLDKLLACDNCNQSSFGEKENGIEELDENEAVPMTSTEHCASNRNDSASLNLGSSFSSHDSCILSNKGNNTDDMDSNNTVSDSNAPPLAAVTANTQELAGAELEYINCDKYIERNTTIISRSNVPFNIESKSNTHSETISPAQESDAVVPEVPFAENHNEIAEVRPSPHPLDKPLACDNGNQSTIDKNENNVEELFSDNKDVPMASTEYCASNRKDSASMSLHSLFSSHDSCILSKKGNNTDDMDTNNTVSGLNAPPIAAIAAGTQELAGAESEDIKHDKNIERENNAFSVLNVPVNIELKSNTHSETIPATGTDTAQVVPGEVHIAENDNDRMEVRPIPDHFDIPIACDNCTQSIVAGKENDAHDFHLLDDNQAVPMLSTVHCASKRNDPAPLSLGSSLSSHDSCTLGKKGNNTDDMDTSNTVSDSNPPLLAAVAAGRRDFPKTESQDVKSKSLSTNVFKSELIPLNPDQISCLPFPIGCNVCSSFQPVDDGEMFRRGQVINASLNFISREFYYEVLFDEGGPSWIVQKELAYAPASSVYFSPSIDSEQVLTGEIILCRTRSSYRALLNWVKQLNDDLLVEFQDLANGTKNDDPKLIEVWISLCLMDASKTDQFILNQTNVEQIVASISQFSADEYAELSSKAKQLLNEWQAQVTNTAKVYYTVLISHGSGNFNVIENIQQEQLKFKGDSSANLNRGVKHNNEN